MCVYRLLPLICPPPPPLAVAVAVVVNAEHTAEIRSIEPPVAIGGGSKITVHGDMLLSDFPTNPSPAREVTSLAIKVVNDAGSPGDSAIGPNGDFCSLFDVKEDEQDAFGYKDGNNGWVTCAFTEPRQAGVYNISMV